MKKISLTILFVAALAFTGSLALTSCGSKSHDETHAEEEAAEEMHEHEGEGHDSDAHEHEGEEMAYACPMHPEEKGNEGDKCPKCKMALEKIEKTEE